MPTSQLNSVKFFDAYTGVTCGVGGVWRSTNSGVNWVQVLNTTATMNSISFPDNNTGYIAGDSGKIFYTGSNGLNWQQIGIGVTNNNLYSVYFRNYLTGTFVGQAGRILYTFNNGASWFIQTDPFNNDLYCIQSINSTSEGYYCGGTTTEAFAQTYLGSNWFYTLNIPGNGLLSLSHIPVGMGNVIAVGGNGRIRRSTNYGSSWTIITSTVNLQFNHVVFLDGNTGYIASNGGYILKSTNSGYNWFIDAGVTSNNLRSISFINSTTAWVVGSNGVVIRQGIPVGIKNNENETLSEFILEQNYPNPFNPATNIGFRIADFGFVTLKVFDILGQEVITLVNEQLQPGRYEVEFPARTGGDGSDLGSGIYFYSIQIITDDLVQKTQIKKMLLIK